MASFPLPSLPSFAGDGAEAGEAACCGQFSWVGDVFRVFSAWFARVAKKRSIAFSVIVI